LPGGDLDRNILMFAFFEKARHNNANETNSVDTVSRDLWFCWQ
jgi:hypothetical protein